MLFSNISNSIVCVKCSTDQPAHLSRPIYFTQVNSWLVML